MEKETNNNNKTENETAATKLHTDMKQLLSYTYINAILQPAAYVYVCACVYVTDFGLVLVCMYS